MPGKTRGINLFLNYLFFKNLILFSNPYSLLEEA